MVIFDVTIAKRSRLTEGSDDAEHFFSNKVFLRYVRCSLDMHIVCRYRLQRINTSTCTGKKCVTCFSKASGAKPAMSPRSPQVGRVSKDTRAPRGWEDPGPRCHPPEWCALRAGCVSGPRHTPVQTPPCLSAQCSGSVAQQFPHPPPQSPAQVPGPCGSSRDTWPLLLQGRVTETRACHTWSLLGGVCFAGAGGRGKDRDWALCWASPELEPPPLPPGRQGWWRA